MYNDVLFNIPFTTDVNKIKELSIP